MQDVLLKKLHTTYITKSSYGSSKLSKREWKLKISGRGEGPRKTFGNDNNLPFNTSKESPQQMQHFGETKFESGLAV